MHEIRSIKPQSICGVDEAGRGPLAGPVTAAAVILPPDFPVEQLRDSKKLTATGRSRLEDMIRREAAAYGIGWAWPAEIDHINILWAAMLAMQRAIYNLLPPGEHQPADIPALGQQDRQDVSELMPPLNQVPEPIDPSHARPAVIPDLILVDGNRCPDCGDMPCRSEIKGDDRFHPIMAASILAKTARDRWMTACDTVYPGYGFAGHKGYPTSAHREAIRRLGPSVIHRRSFRGADGLS